MTELENIQVVQECKCLSITIDQAERINYTHKIIQINLLSMDSVMKFFQGCDGFAT